MTIVGCSLHQVCDGNCRKKCTTPLTHKHFKRSICHCSESYRLRLSQLRRHSLHQRTVTVVPFRACTYPVKHEMETSIISSSMKTIQPRRLCKPECKCGLGLCQIYFVAWILHETNSVHVADARIVDGASVVQMLNHGTSIMFQDWRQSV